jgi:hypothetical protein
MSDERADAIRLANKLLDDPHCDPDDDLRMLSRQLLRREEFVASIAAAMSVYCESGGGATPKVVLLFETLDAAQLAHKFAIWSASNRSEKP